MRDRQSQQEGPLPTAGRPLCTWQGSAKATTSTRIAIGTLDADSYFDGNRCPRGGGDAEAGHCARLTRQCPQAPRPDTCSESTSSGSSTETISAARPPARPSPQCCAAVPAAADPRHVSLALRCVVASTARCAWCHRWAPTSRQRRIVLLLSAARCPGPLCSRPAPAPDAPGADSATAQRDWASQQTRTACRPVQYY